MHGLLLLLRRRLAVRLPVGGLLMILHCRRIGRPVGGWRILLLWIERLLLLLLLLLRRHIGLLLNWVAGRRVQPLRLHLLLLVLITRRLRVHIWRLTVMVQI